MKVRDPDGHRFTGAYRDKPGKLEIADHGTLLLVLRFGSDPKADA